MHTQIGNVGPPEAPPAQEPARRQGLRGNLAGGLALIVLGLLFLAHSLFPELRVRDYWPLILVGLGAYILWKSGRA